MLKELLRGPELLDDSRELGNRELDSLNEVVALMPEMAGRGLVLATRKEKRDYDKISWIELYFQPKP